MAKANEIAYIEEVARLDNVPLADCQTYLLNKPFSDPRCREYLIAKYGTTEKDMPYRLQKKHMKRAGFASIKQYPRAVTRGDSLFHCITETVRLALGSSS